MKKLMVLVVASLMLVFCNATVSQAVTLGFDPISQEVLLGDQADVELVISGLGWYAPDSLSTFDLDIGYDPTILGFNSATFGDPVLGDQLDLWTLGSLTAVTPRVGTVNLYELSFDTVADLNDYQADSFTLATLTFNTLAVGTSPLGISINALGDSWGDLLVADIQGGSISPVPEPATLLLVGSGLAGIFGLGRKRWSRS
jgi:hypothetical protein